MTNKVHIDGGRAGISLLRSQNVEITANNEVMIFNSDDNEPRGIEIKDCRESSVSCNVVVADDLEADTWGLHIQDSPDMLYSCNTTDNLTHNTQFLGMCTNNDYRGSSIGNGYAGLELGSAAEGSEAIIGLQVHTGNQWHPNYDWKGAWHYSSNQNIIQGSRFTTRSTAALNPPNLSELVSLGWFLNSNDGPTTFECEQQDCETELEQIHEEDLALLDSIEFGEHSGVKNWLKERQIFRRLDTGLIDPGSHSSLGTFYSIQQGTIVGEQVEIDQRLRQAFRLSGADSTDRANYLIDRNELLDSLLTLGSLLIEADSAEAVVIREDISSVVTDLETIKSTDAGWMDDFMIDLASTLSDIEYDNGQITVKEDWEEYDQIITDILLNCIDGDSLVISSSDSTTLYDIASLCAFEGGPGVYHARALYALIDTLIFDDYDTCGTVSPRSAEAYAGFVDSRMVVTPNPALEDITVYYLGKGEPDQLLVISTAGTRIKSYSFKERKGQYDVSGVLPGLYYCVLTKQGSIIDVQKLVIANE